MDKGWGFDRYVDGVLMAEGVHITQAGSLEEAMRKAVRLCPKRPGTVLVHCAVGHAAKNDEPAIRSAAEFLLSRYAKARCDSEAVSDCVRCNAVYLARVTLRDLCVGEEVRAA